MMFRKIIAVQQAARRKGSARGSHSRTMLLAALFTLPLLGGCENNDDPVEQLRDTAEEVREGVEEAANDTRRKIEDLQD